MCACCLLFVLYLLLLASLERSPQREDEEHRMENGIGLEQVVMGPDGSIAWTCVDSGPLGLDFGLTELDEGMIGLQVKQVAEGSMASLVSGLKPGMVLQQIDEFHIRE